MKSMKIKIFLILLISVIFYSKVNAQEITYFPNGPYSYYEKDGLEIKSFRSCGTYVYGPQACYRIRNKNNYTVIFRIQFLLKNGNWKTGEERRIGAGEIEDLTETHSCFNCPGVADIKIEYVQ